MGEVKFDLWTIIGIGALALAGIAYCIDRLAAWANERGK